MKRFIVSLLLSLVFIFLPATTLAQEAGQNTIYQGTIQNISGDPKESQIIDVKLTSGPLKDKQYQIKNKIQTPYDYGYKKGDHVLVSYTKDQGKEFVYVVDYARNQSLFILGILFLVFILYVARWQGLASMIGMLFSLLVIGKFMIPSILLGNDPLLVSLFGALFIIPVTFYISHGINKKTTVAIVGTFLCLILVAALSLVFVEFSRLTGFANEEAVYIQSMHGDLINIKSLLLAGIIIGGLAVLNDITISQASIVNELYSSNSKLTFQQVYKNAMAVGRDHVASLVNTLILVYAGASLPLFLLFYNSKVSFFAVMNQEIVATEIVRTLVSSIGIVAAVPITTLLACAFLKKK